MMVRQLAVFGGALALAVGLAWASQAEHERAHFKAVYNAPFVATGGGGKIADSVGRIGIDGSYAVELNDVAAEMTYAICLETENLGVVFLTNANSDLDGGIEVTDSLAGILMDGVTTLQVPRFQVRDGVENCAGMKLYESGMDVEIMTL